MHKLDRVQIKVLDCEEIQVKCGKTRMVAYAPILIDGERTRSYGLFNWSNDISAWVCLYREENIGGDLTISECIAYLQSMFASEYLYHRNKEYQDMQEALAAWKKDN